MTTLSDTEQLTLDLSLPASQPDLRLSLNNVGPALRRIRVMKGLTQSEVAERALVTDSSISKIENGHRIPTLEVVIDLLRAMNYELSIAPKEADNGSLR